MELHQSRREAQVKKEPTFTNGTVNNQIGLVLLKDRVNVDDNKHSQSREWVKCSMPMMTSSSFKKAGIEVK